MAEAAECDVAAAADCINTSYWAQQDGKGECSEGRGAENGQEHKMLRDIGSHEGQHTQKCSQRWRAEFVVDCMRAAAARTPHV